MNQNTMSDCFWTQRFICKSGIASSDSKTLLENISDLIAKILSENIILPHYMVISIDTQGFTSSSKKEKMSE